MLRENIVALVVALSTIRNHFLRISTHIENPIQRHNFLLCISVHVFLTCHVLVERVSDYPSTYITPPRWS